MASNEGKIVVDLGFRMFDADNHYYEDMDAFSRYIEPEFRKRTMQWADLDGKPRLLVGGKVNRFIPNPTWDPVSKPGALDQYFRGSNPKGEGTRDLFGELDPLADHPEYQDRDERLRLMDDQGIEAAIFLPTLGVGMEQALIHDVPALCAAFRSFNRWLDEDWGFAYQERIFGAPYISFVDPDFAVSQLEWALDHDARILVMVPGPIVVAGVGRSPADPIYDPFWARVNESGAVMAYHGGNSHYQNYLADWGEPSEMESFRSTPFRALVSHEPVHDAFGNLLAHGLFHRFPNIRMAAIETGSVWVLDLFRKLKKSFGQNPKAYPEDPRETFRRHVWVSPYYEDPLGAVRDAVGAERLLMGSDYPHAEGLAVPAEYIKDLKNFDFSDDECRLVMRENGMSLVRRSPA